MLSNMKLGPVWAVKSGKGNRDSIALLLHVPSFIDIFNLIKYSVIMRVCVGMFYMGANEMRNKMQCFRSLFIFSSTTGVREEAGFPSHFNIS